jgi:hypothetical protein
MRVAYRQIRRVMAALLKMKTLDIEKLKAA